MSYETGDICHYCARRLIWFNTPRCEPYYHRTDTYTPHWVRDKDYGIYTVDHVIARSKGGSNDDDNKVPCCCDCNNRKRAKDYDKFWNELWADKRFMQERDKRREQNYKELEFVYNFTHGYMRRIQQFSGGNEETEG